MKTYYQITCELYTEHVVPVINAKQYDSGRGVDITLTDCGAVVVPAVSDVCNLYCKKSDGTVSYISGTVNGSAVRVDFTNTLLAEAGVVECELEVTSGADTVSTPVFRMVVLPSNYDQGAIASQDEFTALETALQTVSGLDGRVLALEATAATLGDAATYDVANNLTTATAGSKVLDAAQGKALGDRMTTAEGNITTLDGSTAKLFAGAAGLWLGKLTTSNEIAFYNGAYPSGSNLLGTVSLTAGEISPYFGGIRKIVGSAAADLVFQNSRNDNRYAALAFCVANSGDHALYFVRYKADNTYTGATKIAGGTAVQSISVAENGNLTIRMAAYSSAYVLYANAILT